ncbi:hypothetical protein [Chitinibacter sp. GC72]|uniref:hypothetical protein n=1 Tax=Chitinibacter sp. GC72 TaxID=1526917 RepID=UPI0012F7F452|nr:hypothetical protein [Chitinibacter sp. GC72]
MTQLIIGLHGQAGAGKDTVADFLVANHNFVKIAYADKLREEIAHAWGIKPELLINRAQKEIPQVPLEISRCQDSRFVRYILDKLSDGNEAAWYLESATPRSPRWIMQQWGDYRRSVFGEDYFLIEMANKIAELDSHVVISDVRLDKEAEQLSVDYKAHLWRIQRPNLAAVQADKTEAGIALNWIDVDIINIGSINDLYEHVGDALNKATFGYKARRAA